MRLPADKVKEAILHSHQDVRDAAVFYFANSYSSDPTIMPLVVIQAIDKFGFDNRRLRDVIPFSWKTLCRRTKPFAGSFANSRIGASLPTRRKRNQSWRTCRA